MLRSHFLELLSTVGCGKSVMADKGFDIQDLLVPYGVKLNLPPFKRAGQQMVLEDVQKNSANSKGSSSHRAPNGAHKRVQHSI